MDDLYNEIPQDFFIGDFCAVVVCTRKLNMFPSLILSILACVHPAMHRSISFFLCL